MRTKELSTVNSCTSSARAERVSRLKARTRPPPAKPASFRNDRRPMVAIGGDSVSTSAIRACISASYWENALAADMAGSFRLALRTGCLMNRRLDAVIGGAPADIARHRCFDIGIGWFGMLGQ